MIRRSGSDASTPGQLPSCPRQAATRTCWPPSNACAVIDVDHSALMLRALLDLVDADDVGFGYTADPLHLVQETIDRHRLSDVTRRLNGRGLPASVAIGGDDHHRDGIKRGHLSLLLPELPAVHDRHHH